MPLPLTAQVGNISNTSYPDGSPAPLLAGKAGEAIVAELHGKFYSANYRGLVYVGTTATAGTTIPIQAGNLASTFTLWNPLGSGKNLELISYDVSMLAATDVVSDISLYYLPNINSTANLSPTSLTALTIRSAILGNGSVSVASLFSAATLVGTPLKVMSLAGPNATTSTNSQSNHYEFDGRIIVPPGTLITVAGNAAQTSAASQTFVWSEWAL